MRISDGVFSMELEVNLDNQRKLIIAIYYLNRKTRKYLYC